MVEKDPFGLPSESIEDDDDKETIEASISTRLPRADAMDSSSAEDILSSVDAKIIAFVGAYDAGKTSLVGGLYELMQVSPVGGSIFAGSRTLHALEQICHNSRTASKRDEAASERTKYGVLQFYHLHLLADREISLLFADRSGEQYDEIIEESDDWLDVPELTRADTICLVVDGRKLSNNVERHNVKADLMTLMQVLVDRRTFARVPDLAVVLTKIDDVDQSSRREDAYLEFDGLVHVVRNKFGRIFRKIESFRTAASPKQTDHSIGTGIGSLLDFWLLEADPVPTWEPPAIKFSRAIAWLQQVE
ncbi:hypothetical protein FHL81_19935 [Agrobacterium tumefaciens]|uniref:TRAFAC clade GTPase domain-containing protein n=1 Tax=Agrobacterium tumefaciens TaxID=358 RepID=UPI0011F1BCFD|nr:hypothetical protein [Agrobacterium tumefaciens]KAA1233655.1 hypothetical protein FHL81_19935 [Agrobacterium tumefaciens]